MPPASTTSASSPRPSAAPPSSAQPPALVGRARRQVADIARRRRLDQAHHAVHVRAGVQQAARPAPQPLGIEAGIGEPPAQLRIEPFEVVVEGVVRQTGTAVG